MGSWSDFHGTRTCRDCLSTIRTGPGSRASVTSERRCCLARRTSVQAPRAARFGEARAAAARWTASAGPYCRTRHQARHQERRQCLCPRHPGAVAPPRAAPALAAAVGGGGGGVRNTLSDSAAGGEVSAAVSWSSIGR